MSGLKCIFTSDLYVCLWSSGAYAQWICHSQPSTFIALRYILSALQEKAFFPVAARALNSLLKCGSRHFIQLTSTPQDMAQNSFYQQILGTITQETVNNHLKMLFDVAVPLTVTLERV
jgi:hypothetical protein